MDIDIRTRNSDLVSSLFQGREPEVGDQITLDQGIEVTFRGIRRMHGMMESGIDIVSLAVAVVTGIGTGVVANWIWHHIKDKEIDAITIERTTLEVISEAEILRILRENLTINSDDQRERKG